MSAASARAGCGAEPRLDAAAGSGGLITSRHNSTAGTAGLEGDQKKPCKIPDARREWLAEVLARTEWDREKRAREHDSEAFEAANRYVSDSYSPKRPTKKLSPAQRRARAKKTWESSRAVWHAKRAGGLRNRFEKVSECGKWTATITCPSGSERQVVARCGNSRICQMCREANIRRLRYKFAESRRHAVELATRRRMMLGQRNAAAQWSERFLTLTAPHRAPLRARVELVKLAWSKFRRWMRGVFKREEKRAARKLGKPKSWPGWRQPPRCHWYSVFEWTPGEDGHGHPHIHVWMLGPYLHHAEIVKRWAAAYRSACKELGQVVCSPAKDFQVIKQCWKGRVDGEEEGKRVDVAYELIKYMTKDLGDGEKDGLFVSPRIFARALIALEGLRRTQGSRGFISLRLGPGFFLDKACSCCGVLSNFSASCKVAFSETFNFQTASAAPSRLRAPGVHRCGP